MSGKRNLEELAIKSLNDSAFSFSYSQFKELRILKGLTREQLLPFVAEYKRTTAKTIYTWETGRAPIPPYAIMALLQANNTHGIVTNKFTQKDVMSKFKSQKELELYLSESLKNPSPELIRRIGEYHDSIHGYKVPDGYKNEQAYLLSNKDILKIEVMMYEDYTSCELRSSLFTEECLEQDEEFLNHEFGTGICIELLLEEIGFEGDG